MTETAVPAPPVRVRRCRQPLPFAVRTAYEGLGLLLAAYLAAIVVSPALEESLAVSGWAVSGFEIMASLLCFAAAVVRPSVRPLALVFGCALLAWSVGDVLLTIQSMGGASPPLPSVSDLFYLSFYPLAYVAIVLLLRRQLGSLTPANWLDGAVAGLGAAVVLAATVFPSIVHAAGDRPVAVTVNLAYPVGDVLLLALAVGGTALVGSRRNRAWLLVVGACALNALGDTFNLLHNSVGNSGAGEVVNAMAWPTGILVLSLAVWMIRPTSRLLVTQRPNGFALPGLAACATLAILLVGTVVTLSRVAVALAAVTLVLVGIRLSLSVRALRRLTLERHRLSVTDELTGLGNRRSLFETLDAFFADSADAAGRPDVPDGLAFIFLDLDHFKEVNDSFGHSAGDELLRQLGPRLAGTLRGSDMLVRLGGDEFALVLMEADAAYATAVAKRLAAALEARFSLQMVSAHISASMGIALAPTDATSSAELLRCADVAMYRAKVERVPFAVYDPDIDDDGNVLALADELRDAVAWGSFELHYQAQLDLHDGTVCATEALLRWPHPRLGMVPPLKFIPLAEEAGLMSPLTAWVLDQALAQCAAWRPLHPDLAMSVNISSSNLLDGGFAFFVAQLLERHGLPASALVLEITETCIITEYERARAVIAELAATGIVLSVDDFGAGFTSLAYLSDLAVGELKLDRTFIAGLTPGSRDGDLVRATINLGHALGLRVVAEGIEDRATLDLLGTMGCDIAQGYFISRPVPAEDVPFSVGLSQDVDGGGSGTHRNELVLHPG